MRRYLLGALFVVAMIPSTDCGSLCLAADPPPLVKVPNPTSGDNPTYPLVPQALPQAGKSFQDARFKTALVRVTEERGLRHEYSRHDPFNCDGTKILLTHTASGEFRVYRTGKLPYDANEGLVTKVDLEEPRWDPANADLLWGSRDFQIRTLNVKTGRSDVVKDFSKDPTIAPVLKAETDVYRITMKDEGETSRDKRYWAVCLQGSKDDYRLRHIAVWDRKEDKVVGLCKVAKEESDIDWVGMSVLGNWVLIGGGSENGPRLSGMTMADRGLTKFHRLDYATAHADIGLDSQGNEVIVMQNVRTDAIDLIPLSEKTKPILDAGGSYEGTGRTMLVRLFYSNESPVGLSSGVHICCNADGWCVVSTYMPSGAKEQNWLDRCVILVRLDPRAPAAYYLAKIHNTRDAYWEEPHASMSSDGSKVVWACNWNQDVGKEKAFLIQLNMPAKWQEALSAPKGQPTTGDVKK